MHDRREEKKSNRQDTQAKENKRDTRAETNDRPRTTGERVEGGMVRNTRVDCGAAQALMAGARALILFEQRLVQGEGPRHCTWRGFDVRWRCLFFMVHETNKRLKPEGVDVPPGLRKRWSIFFVI